MGTRRILSGCPQSATESVTEAPAQRCWPRQRKERRELALFADFFGLYEDGDVTGAFDDHGLAAEAKLCEVVEVS